MFFLVYLVLKQNNISYKENGCDYVISCKQQGDVAFAHRIFIGRGWNCSVYPRHEEVSTCISRNISEITKHTIILLTFPEKKILSNAKPTGLGFVFDLDKFIDTFLNNSNLVMICLFVHCDGLFTFYKLGDDSFYNSMNSMNIS